MTQPDARSLLERLLEPGPPLPPITNDENDPAYLAYKEAVRDHSRRHLEALDDAQDFLTTIPAAQGEVMSAKDATPRTQAELDLLAYIRSMVPGKFYDQNDAAMLDELILRLRDEAMRLATPTASPDLGPFGDMCSSADVHYAHLHPEERESMSNTSNRQSDIEGE